VIVGANIAAQDMTRSAAEQLLHATLDGERVLEVAGAAGIGQPRARLPSAPRREKMAGGLVALGGGQHDRSEKAGMACRG
jgi:hypothetical protein